MTQTLHIGSAVGRPGAVTHGWLPGVKLATGQADDLPVLIADSGKPGPVVWVTATVHGNELTGVHVIHRLFEEHLPGSLLRGAIVAVPLVCPSGLRLRRRTTEYDARDPNRLFPSTYFRREKPAPPPGEDEPEPPPSALELTFERLFQAIKGSADYHLDLHCAMLQSVPFLFRDRVLYRNEEDRAERADIDALLHRMVTATGLPVINEYPPAKYVSSGLVKSFTGATLNDAGVPSATIELGPQEVLLADMVEVGLGAVLNVLRWAEMLPGQVQELPAVPLPPPGEVLRHTDGPRAPAAGLARFLVRPGQWVRAGEPFAEVRDVFGVLVEGGLVSATQDCFVIGLMTGSAVQPNEALALVGVRDTAPTLAQHPEWREAPREEPANNHSSNKK